MSSAGNLVNGKWVEGSGPAFQSSNPANGEVLWEGNSSTQSDVEAALSAARTALADWSARGLDERAKIIEILRRENGNKSRAARALGINRRKLYRLVEKYGIET